jgi:hypothetical protein
VWTIFTSATTVSANTTTQTFHDNFSTKNTTNWVWSKYQTVPFKIGKNNVVKSTGYGQGWNATFYRSTYNLLHKTKMQVRFMVDRADPIAHFVVDTDVNPYQRFGVVADGGAITVEYTFDGIDYFYPKVLIPNMRTNAWYTLEITVDDVNGFTAMVYDESKPSIRGTYTMSMPAGRQWHFRHWIWRGTAYLDAYREYK